MGKNNFFGFFGGRGGLGPELITDEANRTFSEGQKDWVVQSGVNITWDNISMNFNAAALNVVRLPVTHTEGTLYRVEFEILGFTSGTLGVWLGDLGDPGSNVISADGVYVFNMVANETNLIVFGTAAFVGSVDNVSIKAVL